MESILRLEKQQDGWDESFFLLQIFQFSEREVRQAVGSAAQLFEDRSVHVSEQLPRLQSGEAHGFEEYSRPFDQHHILQNEGLQISILVGSDKALLRDSEL